jgi:RNA polymerase sigma factor (sigma-70 family)
VTTRGTRGSAPHEEHRSLPVAHLDRRRADHVLALRCVDGDREAQRALFAAHKDRVHVILFRILGSNHEMEDLVQDSFFEIFRSLSAYRGDAQLGTWIDRITARVAYRHLSQRKPGRVQFEVVRNVVDDGAPPDARVAARDAARRLYAILDTLEPSHRIAFTLHVIDGRPMREVASVTGASVVATKVRVWRARRAVEAKASSDPHLADLVGGGES